MATIEVSGGGSALQTAINNARAGDTLLVHEGVYTPITVNIGIEIVGVTDGVIIDGGHTYDGSDIYTGHTGERCVDGYGNDNLVIRNITLRNGYAEKRGCLGITRGQIIDCRITDNVARYGGVTADTPKLNFHNCEFIRNSATQYGGVTSNAGMFYDCIFDDNYLWLPDLIQTEWGFVALVNGRFRNVFERCIFRNHTYRGKRNSEVYIIHGDAILRDCVFSNNKSETTPGLFTAILNGATCTNCLVDETNGLKSIWNNFGTLTNCTFMTDAGLRNGADEIRPVVANNCIFKSIRRYYSGDTSTLTLNNCLVKEGVATAGTLSVNNTLENTDPLLRSDYQLSKDSPCVGAGSSEYLVSAKDLNGRYWKTPPSIGCYECYRGRNGVPGGLLPLG